MAETETEIEVTPEVLRELLDYDPETGVLTWKHRDVKWFRETKRAAQTTAKAWNTRFSGRPAFTAPHGPKGYLQGIVLARHFLAHRVAFAIMTGAWPENGIDHVDGDTSNNRWSNLRPATDSENSRNRGPFGRTGYKGVYERTGYPGRFKGSILVHGKLLHLGYSSDPEELARRWDKKAKELHGEFAKLNFPDE